jgi:SAM-dependent methyltransferase
MRDGYPISRCRTCGLVQVDVELGPEELDAIYGEAYFSEAGPFDGYVAERQARLESGRRLTAALSQIVPEGRLLDVGCAAGFFLAPAAERYEVTGVEVSSYAAEYARREFGLRVLTGRLSDVGLEGERFDVITLWNTVEHLADPLATVRCLTPLVAPGSLLVMSTGDASGPLARRNLAQWNLMSPPFHLFFFTPSTIDRLLAETGFRLRRVVYDGVVAEGGPLASTPGRQVAALAGTGNVMTVYAQRTDAVLQRSSFGRRLTARYRPLSRLRRGAGEDHVDA